MEVMEMVIMKKSICLVILLGFSTSFLQALVEPLSQARIESTVAELNANDSARLQLRLLLASVTLGTTGFYVYRWLNQKAEKANQSEQIEDLGKQIAGIKAQLKEKGAEKKAEDPVKKEPELPWYKQLAHSAWGQIKSAPGKIKGAVMDLPNTVANGVPWFATMLVVNNLMPVGNRFFRFFVPMSGKVTDYLFQSHTVAWFVEHKINLRATVEGLMRWVEEDKEQVTDIAQFKEELADKTNLLVRDVERIFGYMQYVTKQLPQTDPLMIKRSEAIQAQIKERIAFLSTVVNNFVTEQLDASACMAKVPVLNVVIRRVMLKILDGLKDFEFVQEVAGYQDTMPTRIFVTLHEIITKGAYRAVQEEEIRAMVMDAMGQMQLEGMANLGIDPAALLQGALA
jgi:hypothetical protein